jgi:Na+/H+ antiporter NhaD/arsenite permease-like protein
VVTGSLLQSGSLQVRLGGLQSRLVDPAVTAMVSFWASQLFSNVPVVDIYLKLLQQAEIPNLIMLAGMSTLAGNLFIISAASNVIVVQQAEKLGRGRSPSGASPLRCCRSRSCRRRWPTAGSPGWAPGASGEEQKHQ